MKRVVIGFCIRHLAVRVSIYTKNNTFPFSLHNAKIIRQTRSASDVNFTSGDLCFDSQVQSIIVHSLHGILLILFPATIAGRKQLQKTVFKANAHATRVTVNRFKCNSYRKPRDEQWRT